MIGVKGTATFRTITVEGARCPLCNRLHRGPTFNHSPWSRTYADLGDPHQLHKMCLAPEQRLLTHVEAV